MAGLLPLLCAALVGNLFAAALILLALVYTALVMIGAGWLLLPLLVLYIVCFVWSIMKQPERRPNTGVSSLWAGSPFWGYAFEYFQGCRHVFNVNDYDPDQQYIHAIGPHGIHCWALMAFSWTNSWWRKAFPARPYVGIVADIMFYIPIVRELFLGGGYVSASRSVCERALKEGNHLFICTGGEAESMLTKKGHDRLVLHRTGFVRLAMKFGADIVPTYAFGATDLYDTYDVLIGFRMWLQKRFKIALPLFTGRWLTAIPHPARMVVVSGPPFKVPKPETPGTDPDPKEVKAVHAQYVAHVQKFFDDAKVKHGFADRKLELH